MTQSARIFWRIRQQTINILHFLSDFAIANNKISSQIHIIYWDSAI